MTTQKDKKEIGYYNTSTGAVIPGYSALYHNLSAEAAELDKKGHIKYVERIAGGAQEITLNVGGQLILDKSQRGGKRLWQRIYTRAEIENLLEEKGVVLSRKTAGKSPAKAVPAA